METTIAVGSPLARKIFGVGLFTQWQHTPGFGRNLRGPMPKQSDAESNLRYQSSPDMPVVMATELAKTAGDNVSVDCVDVIGGVPLMGDQNAEGTGEPLTFSSMDVRIDLATKVVNAGGKMTQQRTVHELRNLARAQLVGWWARHDSQSTLVHLAGARGTQTGRDWVIPLVGDAQFSNIMVNAVKAPTYNRHWVANGLTVTQGGAQLGSIANTDILRLEHLDALATILDDMPFALQPVKLADDPARNDSPMYCMYVTARQWNSILTTTSGGIVWRNFLQNAWERKSYGSKHPLFTGETGMWRNILVKKMDRFAVRYLASEATNIVTAANRYTATETSQAVNAGLGAGYAVDRAILLGAQGLAFALGKNTMSQYHFAWLERMYNFDRNMEVGGDMMGGKAKVRFGYPDGDGNVEPTDHGVIVLDTAVAL